MRPTEQGNSLVATRALRPTDGDPCAFSAPETSFRRFRCGVSAIITPLRRCDCGVSAASSLDSGTETFECSFPIEFYKTLTLD